MKIDSSSLIYLTKIDLIDHVVNNFSPIRITESVFSEVIEKGKEMSFGDAFILEKMVEKKKITVVPNISTIPDALISLGLGEQSSIAEATKEKELLLIDDVKARRRATSLSVDVLGTEAIILSLLHFKKLSYDEFEEKINAAARIMSLKASKIMALLSEAKKLAGKDDAD